MRSAQYQEKMGSLLSKKQKEEDIRLHVIVDKLKNKGNKRCDFRMLRNVDNDRLLQYQLD